MLLPHPLLPLSAKLSLSTTAPTYSYSTLLYLMNVVRLSPASPTADLRALEEVSDFATTDMGWGGEERWTYRKLKEEEVIPEILRISHHGLQEDVDYITFQPCMTYESRSQDRFVVQNWDLQGKRWTFTAIFDGEAVAINVSITVGLSLSTMSS